MPVRIGVYCGSNLGASSLFAANATRLGSAIARRGFGLVYGGANVGLMGLLADAAIEHGAEVIGVIPRRLVDIEIAHRGLTRLEVVDSMHERKALMMELADGFVALPGGFGTLDEVFEILTWDQLGLIAKPVVFLDVDGFYTELFAFLDKAVDAGFLRGTHRLLAQRALSVDEALALASGPVPAVEQKWIDRDPS
jgi:uncharacterized protein (TIGR00730 family)